MFPFTLTKMATIDNEFLDSMMHDATQGIGSAAQTETLERSIASGGKSSNVHGRLG